MEIQVEPPRLLAIERATGFHALLADVRAVDLVEYLVLLKFGEGLDGRGGNITLSAVE